MSEVGKPAVDAESAVHSLVHAIREALACGITCTNESGSVLDTSQVDALCKRSREAMGCVRQIEQALLSSLEQPESGEEGVEELEKRRQSLAEEAELKNSHLKSVIDKLRTILAAIDSWNE